MSRLAFRLQPIPTASGSVVRIDTASGSNTPADVRTLGGSVIDGALVRSGSHNGILPTVLGPDGATTLYQKTLDYRGQVVGTPVTLTGEDDNPSSGASQSGTYAPLAVVPSSGARAVGQGELGISVRDSGAKGDAQTYFGATSAAGAKGVTLTGVSPFTQADVGKLVMVYTGTEGAAGAITTIAAVNSSSSITLTANAGITASGGTGYITYGTDDTTAIQNALNAAGALSYTVDGNQQSGYVDVLLPAIGTQAGYIITAPLTVPSGVCIDMAARVYNMLASRNTFCIQLNRLARARRININALWGTGVRIGQPGVQYATSIVDDVRVNQASGGYVKPTSLGVATATTGGTLGAGTYFYVVTGIDAQGGESTVTNEVSVTTTGTTSANTLTWTGDASFASYKVYRGTVSRGERQSYTVTGATTYTDTNAAAASGPPLPVGIGVALFGVHHEIGRILVGTASVGVWQQGTDASINSADLIGCTTGWRGYLATNTSCPNVIIDTVGGTDSHGYASEGGVVFDWGSAHITMKVKAFQTFATVCSPVVNIGPYTTSACGDLNIDINANNTGGTVLALANCRSSMFRLVADNTAFNGSPSLPITKGVSYGSGLRSDIRVQAVLDPGVTTSSSGTPLGQFEYLQNGAIGSNLAAAAPNVDGPSDNSQVAWTDDAQHINGNFTPASGVLHLARLVVRGAATVSNLSVFLNSGGGNLVVGQCFLGLYDSAGNLLGSTADVQSAWNASSTVSKTVALTTPVAVTPGNYYVGVLLNWATTGPTLGRTGSTGINFGRGVAPFRWTLSGSGLTALPASVTLSGGSALNNALWASAS